MKIKNLFMMSLAALSLVACSNDEDLVPQTTAVVVNLTSTAPTTKADPTDFTEQALASLTAEKTISTGSLYVFEGDKYYTQADINGTSVTIPGLTIGNTYSFAAVVNPGTNSITATTKAGLQTEVIALSAKTSGAFVMYGESVGTLTVQDINANPEATNTLGVEVKRVLSGVQLVSIKTNFGSNVPLFAREGTAVVKSLELLGTNPTSALNGNKIDGTKINGVDATFGEGLSFDKDGADVTVTASDNSNRAYCCPGSVQYVVLNVTYTHGTETYDRAYNITSLSNLSDGLVANTLYGLKVTLTGAGSDTGGDPDDFEEAAATLSVANWSNGRIYDVPEQEN